MSEHTQMLSKAEAKPRSTTEATVRFPAMSLARPSHEPVTQTRPLRWQQIKVLEVT